VEVNAVLGRYQTELDAACSATLSVTCAEEGTLIVVDGARATACPNGPIIVVPGEHQIVASRGHRSSTHHIKVASESFGELHIDLSGPQVEVHLQDQTGEDGIEESHSKERAHRTTNEQVVTVQRTESEDEVVDGGSAWWAWGLTGLGVASLGIATVYDFTAVRAAGEAGKESNWDQASRDEWDDRTTVTYSLGIAGVALTSAGVLALYFTAADDDLSDDDAAVSLSVGMAPTGIHGVVRW
jgi:hypothetical protein